MRRSTVVAGLVAGVVVVLAVARVVRRPSPPSRPRPVQPIPPTLPPGADRGGVPRSPRATPDLQPDAIGAFLEPGRRSETIIVTILVVLALAVATGLFVLFEYRGR